MSSERSTIEPCLAGDGGDRAGETHRITVAAARALCVTKATAEARLRRESLTVQSQAVLAASIVAEAPLILPLHNSPSPTQHPTEPAVDAALAALAAPLDCQSPGHEG